MPQLFDPLLFEEKKILGPAVFSLFFCFLPKGQLEKFLIADLSKGTRQKEHDFFLDFFLRENIGISNLREE